MPHLSKLLDMNEDVDLDEAEVEDMVTVKDKNIGNHGYIGSSILQIYQIYWRYIDGYFDTKYRLA